MSKMSNKLNELICNRNGIEIRLVGDVYSHYEDGYPISQEELSMYMVSTPKECFEGKAVDEIPLSKTMDSARELAVKHLELQF